MKISIHDLTIFHSNKELKHHQTRTQSTKSKNIVTDGLSSAIGLTNLIVTQDGSTIQLIKMTYQNNANIGCNEKLYPDASHENITTPQ